MERIALCEMNDCHSPRHNSQSALSLNTRVSDAFNERPLGKKVDHQDGRYRNHGAGHLQMDLRTGLINET